MPSNLFLDPILNLRTLVAATARWQELTGAADAAEAADAVYLGSALDDETHPRPRVMVGPMPGRNVRRTSTTDYRLTGTLFWELELETPDEYLGDHNAGFAWFLGEVQTLLQQMMALAGTNGYLDVLEYEETEVAVTTPAALNDGKEYWSTIWELSVVG